MAVIRKDLLTFIKNWFYDKDEIDSMLGGNTSINAVGQFSINSNGHLIATIPDGMANPYSINNNGHLIYDTNASVGGS